MGRESELFRGVPSDAPFAPGDLSIDHSRRKVSVAGEPVELTATEYAVLYQLAAQAPNVLTHGLLLQRVWGRRSGSARAGCCGTW